jgi:glutaredoxin 3
MARVEIYSTPTCPYCIMARNLLRKKKILFEEIDVANDPDKRAWLRATTGRDTVPQIFIGGTPVGGYDDLAELQSAGELDALLAGP